MIRASLTILRRANLRHVLGRGRRSALTVAGIAAAVCLVVAVRAIDTTISNAIEADQRGIAGSAQLVVGAANGVAMSESSVQRRIARVPGIEAAVGVSRQTARLTHDGKTVVVPVVGVGADLPVLFPDGLGKIEDVLPVPESAPGTVLATDSLLARLDARPGDRVRLQTPRGRRPATVQLLPQGPISGVNGGVFALASRQDVQRWFSQPRRVTEIFVRVASGQAADDVARQLRRELPAGVLVSRPEAAAAETQQGFDSVSQVSEQATLVALFVAVFVVLNTMWMVVAERRRELAIMRAVGARRRSVSAAIVTEAAVLGAVGATLGLGLGLVLARLLVEQVTESYTVLPITAAGGIDVAWSELAAAWATGPLVGIAGSVLPVLAFGRVPLTALLRPKPAYDWSSSSDGAAVPRLTLAGLALMVVAVPLWVAAQSGSVSWLTGVTLVLFLSGLALLVPAVSALLIRGCAPVLVRCAAVPGLLAAGGLTRNPRRTGLTVGALALSASMVIGTGGGIGSYEGQVKQSAREWYSAPLYLTALGRTAYQSDQPLPPGLQRDLESIDGVRAAHPMRFAMIRYEGEPLLIYAFPLVEAALTGDQITRGIGISQADLADGLTPTSVVLSRRASRQLDRQVGDSIRIPLRHRNQFRVSEQFNDLGNINTLYMEHDAYRRASGDNLVDRFAILLDDDADAQAVARRLQRLVDRRELPAEVRTGGEMADAVVDSIKPIFAMAKAIQVASLLVALLVVATTMLTATLERRGEFALQRALGLPSRKLGRTVVLEASATGVVGAVMAVAGGVVIGMLVKLPIEAEIGWTVPYRLPLGLAAATVASVTVLTLVAALLPARRAARTPIAEVLREE